jgi:hypothetical protein
VSVQSVQIWKFLIDFVRYRRSSFMDEFLQLQRGAQPAYCLIKFHAVAYLRTGGRKVPQTETVDSNSELIKVPLWAISRTRTKIPPPTVAITCLFG